MDRILRHLSIALLLGSLGGGAAAGVLDQLERIGAPVKLEGTRDFLPPDQAFRLRESVTADGDLEVHWDIEPGYYLYRDKLALSARTPGAELGQPQLPDGEFKEDPEFGRVEVYKHTVAMRVPLVSAPPGESLLETEVRYQGCAEDGICYPPIKKTLGFSLLSNAQAAPSSTNTAAALSASDRITRQLGERSLATTFVTFLGLGLLLAFTPCVFPMVPILSGIIVGQKQPVTTGRALTLSAIYVLAMAATYTVAGVVAGLAGKNLHAAFQQPAVIMTFAAVFVALALSMFGFYELQLPSAVQSRLDRLSRRQRSGTYTGVAVMGVASAIIVGPCVAPPLAGALAYIGQTGSPLIGGAALFALGLGMGLPLLVIGTSAGALLPRAGKWMERVKNVFGVIFLGVAIWFLERVIPPPATMMLWAALLIGSAVFLGALVRLERGAAGHERLQQALGVVLLVYGVVLLVGAAAGGRDPFAPLATLGGGQQLRPETSFEAVKSSDELDRHLASAANAERAVMLDFYADWCIECKHLERETFAAPEVRERLEEMLLLRADVTANDALDQALLKRFELFGPPAVLFFRGGAELRADRLIGFADAAAFGALLDRIESAP